jgi:hypothetical protein
MKITSALCKSRIVAHCKEHGFPEETHNEKSWKRDSKRTDHKTHVTLREFNCDTEDGNMFCAAVLDDGSVITNVSVWDYEGGRSFLPTELIFGTVDFDGSVMLQAAPASDPSWDQHFDIPGMSDCMEGVFYIQLNGDTHESLKMYGLSIGMTYDPNFEAMVRKNYS